MALSWKLRAFLLLTVLPWLSVAPAHGQDTDPLRLFGYFQNQFRYSAERGFGAPPTVTSFSVQQLNVLMARDFRDRFSAFVDVELTNTFSTDKQTGGLQLEEAWVRYHHSNALKVKAGLHVPAFNNLNEIKNRTPLLPYVIRPVVYESSFRKVIQISDYVPQQAFLQVYGTLPRNEWRIDYAAYVGNQTDFVTTETVGSIPSGSDLSTGKLVGGRVGLRQRGLNLGVSSTYDTKQGPGLLGDVPRVRLGGDFSYSLDRLYFESEAISVSHLLSDRQHALLDAAAAQNPFAGTSLDQHFFHVLLGYHPTEAWMVYVSYDYLDDLSLAVGQPGLILMSAGTVYRPLNSIALKTQYVQGFLKDRSLIDYYGRHLVGAVSVMF